MKLEPVFYKSVHDVTNLPIKIEVSVPLGILLILIIVRGGDRKVFVPITGE